VEREKGLGVVGMLGEGQGKSLILNGHVDVVPAGDRENWRFDPWRATVADGRVYGRGALDMKGGLCCALFAAKAILDAGISLPGKLLIHSVIGEEDGGVGTLAAIQRGHVADAAVVVEPTELIVAPAQAGALNFRLTVPGLAAHGCMRQEGVSAIEKFILLYEALMAFEKEYNAAHPDPRFAAYALPYPLLVGTVQAGNWASTGPESLSCEGRFGITVGQDSLAARQQFEGVIAAVAQSDPWLREHPPLLAWWGGQFESAGISPHHPIVTTVTNALQQLTGQPALLRGMTYGADMRLLVNEGHVPTVLFGPGDVRLAHKPDEFVPIADLETVVRTLLLTALRFCR